MRMRTWGSVLGTILLLGLIGGLGYSIFQSGYRQGLVEGADGASQVVYYPGGGGFGVFGLFFGVLFLFMIFGFISRLLFWRRRWDGSRPGVGPSRWSGETRGEWGNGHPMAHKFEQWHERMHAPEPGQSDRPADEDQS
ncbi:MAG: hypothetical protein OEM39_10370 [Acidimicrobiia bacterium]|nr:hypothetical protein [Acidimicrobiia bacterium]